MTTSGTERSAGPDVARADRGRRPWWVTVAWVGAVVCTVLNGIVVGYGAIWLQFFGDRPDAGDYAASAGGYAAATVVLTLAVPAILAHQAPRWLVWPAGGSAVVLAVGSATAGRRAESLFPPMGTAWDGVGGVLWAPWTWALVVLGVRGIVLLSTRASRA